MWRALAAVFLILIVGSTPARAEWIRAESRHFILYSQADEPRVREQIAMIEDFDWLLRRLTGARSTTAPNRLSIYMLRGLHQLRQVRPGIGDGVGGFYTAQPTGIAVFADERVNFGDNPSESRLQTAFHEYTHHFMMQYFPVAYPAWYVEGFAEYMMNTRINGRVIEYGGVARDRALSLTSSNSWLNMDRFLFEPQALTNEETMKFYAQSWIMVHYLLSDPTRRARMDQYLAAFARGEDPRAAFIAAFRMHPDQLAFELRRYIQGGIPATRLTRNGPSAEIPVTVARLPASADRMLLLEAGMTIGLDDPYVGSYVERVRRSAAAFPGDDYARRVLARAEAFYGDGDAADRLLTPMLAAAPNDAELLYLAGIRELMASRAQHDQARARRAQAFFARAQRANPNHVPNLVAYAASLEREPDFISERTSNILLTAYRLAPQVVPITLSASRMLIDRREFARAEAMLAPVAADYHGDAFTTTARGLIAQARAQQGRHGGGQANQEPARAGPRRLFLPPQRR